jgi:hypothetical protein
LLDVGSNGIIYASAEHRALPFARMSMNLPPDPDSLNDIRADQAAVAIEAYKIDYEKTPESKFALADLMCNLRHWADRNGIDWAEALENATENYELETCG